MSPIPPRRRPVPDFDPRPVPPGTYPLWEEALAVVNRDLAVTLPEQGELRLMALPRPEEDEPDQVYVAVADGTWHGNPLNHDFDHDFDRDDPVDALAAVVDAAQESVVERLWQAWPVCEEHGLGMHPQDVDDRMVWWCSGGRPEGRAHLRGAVGELGGA
ncbi:hypothetical protein [Streptomyces sp. NPDC059378]|uniref:hypothetical protein n=1 Tax=Streptomyces sp. NPDC059378 TaxID=3346815 RepID=UPI0036C6AC88